MLVGCLNEQNIQQLPSSKACRTAGAAGKLAQAQKLALVEFHVEI
jgi:hypothetical protein